MKSQLRTKLQSIRKGISPKALSLGLMLFGQAVVIAAGFAYPYTGTFLYTAIGSVISFVGAALIFKYSSPL